MRAVTNRYCSLAFQYNTADASALLDRYQCCGDGTQSSFNQQCYQLGFYQRDCPTAVWNRLDFTLMISGLVVLGVILVEALSLVFAFVGIVNHRYGTLIN
ncbi:hypothetical protein M3Y94_00340400 [Aphelenchoides besseyi]|nr:hypothetical protein M3Y94_00340400 [Aphelenchoides besseyi]